MANQYLVNLVQRYLTNLKSISDDIKWLYDLPNVTRKDRRIIRKVSKTLFELLEQEGNLPVLPVTLDAQDRLRTILSDDLEEPNAKSIKLLLYDNLKKHITKKPHWLSWKHSEEGLYKNLFEFEYDQYIYREDFMERHNINL